VLGSGYALLGVELDSAQLEALTDPLWEQISARRIAITLEDRAPRPAAKYPVCAAVGGGDLQPPGRAPRRPRPAPAGRRSQPRSGLTLRRLSGGPGHGACSTGSRAARIRPAYRAW
jgi:hypothetical protein